MKHVIFDVGRVLINWDIKPLFTELLGSQSAINTFIEKVDFFDWNLQFDKGRKFADGVEEYSEKYPEYADVFGQFDQRWGETIPSEITGTVKLLNQMIDNEIPTYAITNFSAEKWPIACEIYPFLATGFIDTIVSGEVKITKPNLEIYKLLLGRNKLAAEDCIFIDDSQKNIDATVSLGIDALLFVSPERLEDDLKQRDII